MSSFKYSALAPNQSERHQIFCISARARDVLAFADIERIGRDGDGRIHGFQRSKVLGHIKEIRDYLAREDAVLPNSVVVAFTKGVNIKRLGNGLAAIEIAKSDPKPGLIVDGQQRLTALQMLPDKDFEVVVSCIVCDSEEELRRQFILINNTKPLPRSLIYELLPSVDNLPQRLAARTTAAKLVELLNFEKGSSLYGQLKTHTNPQGIIQDSVFQRMLMHSLQDGVLREITSSGHSGINEAYHLLSEFFRAVQHTFRDAWENHTPRTSRLVHGTGIIAMGYVMDELCYSISAYSGASFIERLRSIYDDCAWTDGYWNFGPGEIRKWNDLQVIPRDYLQLSTFLVSCLRRKNQTKTMAKSTDSHTSCSPIR